MATFTPGNPIETADPIVPVEGLAPGSHVFRLVVVDDAGNESVPAFAKVNVRQPDERIEPKVTLVRKLAEPVDADHDPFGKELWVSANGPEAATNATAFAQAISLSERQVVASVRIPGRAGDIAVSRDPQRRIGLVACHGASSVAVLGLPQREVLHVFRVKADPDGVAVTADGTRGLVAIPATGQVIVFDLVEFRVIGELEIGPLVSKFRLAQQSRLAFVNCIGTGEIVGIDIRKPAVVGRFKMEGGSDAGPVQFTVTEAGFPVWSANQAMGAAGLALSASKISGIPLDFKPAGVAADEGGKRAFLVGPESDRLAFVEADVGEARFFPMIAPGGAYKGVAATRDGNLVAAVHPLKRTASVLRGSQLRLRAIVEGLEDPARVILTDDEEFFCILDGKGRTVALVEVPSLR